jgi:hypothetical protein
MLPAEFRAELPAEIGARLAAAGHVPRLAEL